MPVSVPQEFAESDRLVRATSHRAVERRFIPLPQAERTDRSERFRRLILRGALRISAESGKQLERGPKTGVR